MSSASDYTTAPGKLVTPVTITLFIITIIGFLVIGYRFIMGIGAVSNLSDGYPWGVWLAYDVSVGTAFACGGYALAIICYIFNGWKYHTLMRSAIVTSMFGYALAGFSVMVDLGRYWNVYGFFMPSRWQGGSVMFEVAVCVMAYTLVLAIEFLPSLLEKLDELNLSFISKAARAVSPFLDKILIFIVALGITLPTMHQSSLGSLFIIAGHKLHPLWQTNMLPLLFVSNALLLGLSMVVFESSLSSSGFNRPYEKETLELSRFIPYVAAFWLLIRFLDIIFRGHFATIFLSGFHTFFVLSEFILIGAACYVFYKRPTPKAAFYASILMCLGGGLYRMSVYVIGYNPGAEWFAYFPSISEFMVTLGIISFEVLAYIVLVRVLRLLPKPHTV